MNVQVGCDPQLYSPRPSLHLELSRTCPLLLVSSIGWDGDKGGQKRAEQDSMDDGDTLRTKLSRWWETCHSGWMAARRARVAGDFAGRKAQHPARHIMHCTASTYMYHVAFTLSIIAAHLHQFSSLFCSVLYRYATLQHGRIAR